ncbi:MAG: dihydrofolate reductase family protein [Chloroflexi bacterium]|nr:dihydrofolate reductase family protein [Chloroflexota bacterium]OJV89173.1 MAG: hypothetical protein BGO39_34775 [Chloroflexi bacterium 54-19]
MRKLFLLMNISLDGYFADTGGGTSWASNDFEAFSAGESGGVDTLLFGHRTYDIMKSFWPTPQATSLIPEVAKFMNETPKVVASHHGFEPGWENVTVFSGDVVARVGELKAQPGGTIAVFGSSELCKGLIRAGLLDELQIIVNPVVLGKGTSLFGGLPEMARFALTGTREFRSGAVMLIYKPALEK